MAKPELALGTVQLGMAYGIANQTGKPDLEVAFRILDLAYQNGIEIWDTSPAYGESEAVIGKYLVKSHRRPKICSKLPSLTGTGRYEPGDNTLRDYVEEKVAGSLSRLCVDMIDYYLIHDERDFSNFGRELTSAIQGLKERGLLNRVGISVYSPDIALTALQTGQFDAIQLPFNLFDRRFLEIISLADSLGVTVFVRSVFLQGLFFLDVRQLQESLPQAAEAVKKLHILSERYGCSIAQMAMSYLRDLPGVGAILIGVETPEQLMENLACFSALSMTADFRREIDESFQDLPVQIVNPSMWKVAN